MTVEVLAGLAASTTGVFMALAPLLQARRVRVLGDSSEVSGSVYQVMRVNSVAWIVYGVATAKVVIVVPNVVALLTSWVTLLAIRRYRHAEQDGAVPAFAAGSAP
jgi:uncharacterized protein with PQ loop repeat